jgi:hypothetical protein
VAGEDEQWHRWEDRIKSGALLLIGLVGTVNELFIRAGEPRVTALAFLAGVLGLPFVLGPVRRK